MKKIVKIIALLMLAFVTTITLSSCVKQGSCKVRVYYNDVKIYDSVVKVKNFALPVIDVHEDSVLLGYKYNDKFYYPQEIIPLDGVKKAKIYVVTAPLSNYDYEIISQEEVQIKEYKGTDSDVIIPFSIFIESKKYVVTELGEGLITNPDQVKKVIIPYTIRKVLPNTFDNCVNLEYNEYSGGLYLGSYLKPYNVLIRYQNKEINEAVINENTISIADEAFKGCSNLEKITLGKTVKYIGEDAFSECGPIKIIGDRSKVFYSDYTSDNSNNIEWVLPEEDNPAE